MHSPVVAGESVFIMRSRLSIVRRLSALCSVCALPILAALGSAAAEPSPAATAAFNLYAQSVEVRLARQHESPDSFLAPIAPASQREASFSGRDQSRNLNGIEPSCTTPMISRLTPAAGLPLPGATLYHWRGTAFMPRATAADFERLMKDIDIYPQHFSPQVLTARMLTQQGDHLQASMRVRQQHVLTVVLDTVFDIAFGHLDVQHGYSLSRSTQIKEIDSPGTPREHALDPSHEHGFLWRQNTYWSYEERDGGLSMQIESISLTRSVPTGLGWAVGPYVESIPRDSLAFTLRATCNALRR